jgi:crossover junction endodeoxyribonuclease RuvC
MRPAAASQSIVLGIDPGTLVTGYGVVARANGEFQLLDYGTIRNDAQLPLPARLHHIYVSLRTIIEKHRPDQIAIESAFYGKNAQSALKLGHARGVSLLAAVEQSIPTAEYSPREVKKAVVGRGGASKNQVRFMVKAILHLPDRRMALDTSDAIAIALCHLQRLITSSPRHMDWASYVAANPQRIRA